MSDSESFSGDDRDFVPGGGGGGSDGDDDDYGGKKKKATEKKKAAPKKAAAKKSASGKSKASKKGESKEAAPKTKRKATGGKSGGEEKATKSAKPGVVELTGDDATNAVLGYLLQQNRPYSAIQVFDNLHQCVKKPAVIRILNEAAETGKLTKKEWKKNAIFWWNQTNIAAAFGDEDARQHEAETKQNIDTTNTLLAYCKQIENEISNMSSLPNDDECDAQSEQLLKQIKKKQDELKQKTAGAGATVTVTKDQVEKAQKMFKPLWDKWRSHKAGVMSVMLDVHDRRNAGDKVADFLAESGIDTDESLGIVYKDYQSLATRKI